ncbi:MAG: A/G-specific adenine glycosylase, partial [Firmicutes bacterium]|nr:A/G-specific adenine glycosylase [Bacillota bacterium]
MTREEILLLQKVQEPLIAWYDEVKRDLPWRKDVTPYRVWLSGIMLQQTRVEAGKDYFLRFAAELP